MVEDDGETISNGSDGGMILSGSMTVTEEDRL